MLKFRTMNVDAEIRNWSFERVEDMLENWFSDDCTLPANDDPVTFAACNGTVLNVEVFEDIINKCRYTYNEYGVFKEFASIQEMREWALDRTRNGVYHISLLDTSRSFRREQIVELGVKE